MKYFKIILHLTCIFILSPSLTTTGHAEQKTLHVPAAIHISSNISDGKLTIEQLAKIAHENNIKVLVFGDHLLVKIEYGIWPLRRIIKKTIERESVFKYGIKNYLNEIKRVQEKYPDIVLIPGAEVTTFYYWTGNPFKKNLKLHNWNKHILIAGLYEEADYKGLPILSGYSENLGKFNPILLWPLALIFLAPIFFRIRSHNFKDLFGRQWGPYSKKWKKFGIFLILFSILMLVNNYPFREIIYDPYKITSSIGPYQNLIDYVNQKGGVTYWAHPEADNKNRAPDIDVVTPPYPQDLFRAKNYTGYAILYEGYKEIGRPGGIWDSLLDEYCKGERHSPIWAIGELDFETSGSFDDSFRDLSTVLLVPSLTRKHAMKALQTGKMYVIRGQGPFVPVLDEFSIKGEQNERPRSVGDTVNLKSKPIITIKAHAECNEGPPIEKINVKLIRNGQIVKLFETPYPVNIEYADNYFVQGETVNYRLEINFPKKLIITNPIFVRFKF